MIKKKQFSKVFLIAGSEPLGSAGIQADIKAVAACGGYAAGAITCIVDEDTRHVKEIQTIPVRLIVNQATSFLEDVGADCIKTGMLYSTELIEGITTLLTQYRHIPIVIDPVMVSSAGDKLLKDDAIQAYKDRLFPLADIITPNYREAKLLLGRDITLETIREDVKELSQWGNAVIIKSIEKDGMLYDCFYDSHNGHYRVFKKKKIATRNVNGTGDSFASAIAAYLARGYNMDDAIGKAESFIIKAIRRGSEYNFGSGFGPVYPFHRANSLFVWEDFRHKFKKIFMH